MSVIRILDIPIHQVTMSGAIVQLQKIITQGKPSQIVTANPEMVMAARANPALAKVFEEAALVIPDGSGLIWASRVLGQPIGQRVAGIDLMNGLMALSAANGYRVFLLGAAPQVAHKAGDILAKKHPGLHICGTHHGYFSAQEEQAVLAQIRKSSPHILCAALGVPGQELWLFKHLKRLGVPIGMGIGGSLDVIAGKAQRAPQWMQDHNLEWAFRLAREPRRFWRMRVLPQFVAAVLWNKYREVGN